ncbi:MAG: spermidine/putrescine transport system substrate-binding protein [Pseudomonadota bacterium]|nr:spermidine/putrescine transport system substrate-binding protein [Pseudomonadota bacterium]
MAVIALFTAFVYADDVKTVNALAFWGFLDDSKITQIIENKCNVKFSHDAYYTNSEFLNIFNKAKKDYDVMIFSNLIYGSVKDQLPQFNSRLWKASDNYYPYFKNYYLTHGYAHNVAFFTHAMVGFLYNPAVINIKQEQSVFEIFKNAKDNDVILVDDSGEIGNMLTAAYKDKYKINTQTKLTYKNLKSLTQNTHVYITSNFNKIYDSPKFAFAYIWSGDALLYIKKSHKPYKFIMPLDATSVCTDLVVQMKNTPQAKCVAQVLASPLLLKYFESETYYFSPYFKKDIKDKSYDEIYSQAKSNLPHYYMIPPVYDFENYYNLQWDSIKLNYIENNGEPN